MKEQLALLPGYLAGHMELTLIALLVGVLVSVPAGVVAARRPRIGRLVLGASSIIQTIPALALLAIMVPLLAALGLTSIGYLPAAIGLVLYSMLPILHNTITGLTGIDPAYDEAARGVGMTAAQQLRLVDLPLALPVIMAGVRTSAVSTVGMATLSTPIGAPSLGNFIFTGLQTRNLAAVLVGCVGAAALALALDALLSGLTRAIERRRRSATALLTAVALLLLAALAGLAGSRLGVASGPAPTAIRVGAKTFTEQYILADIISLRLAEATGATATVLPSLGSTVAFDALVAGDIDVYVDYSGTLWTTVLGRTDLPPRARLLDELTAALRERHGVRVAARLGFENAYALAMRAAHARALGVTTLSDLARVAPQLTLGADYEFLSRPEWQSLVRTYGLQFRAERSMDPSLMYQAAAASQVDVISAFSTDGRIDAFDLAVIDDDRGAIPPYDALVLVGARFADRDPDAIQALGSLDGVISDDRMRALNRAVDEEGLSPNAAARRFTQAR